jgi:undecaprenyl-diphosphatase
MIIALIQGVTELFPISSLGHAVVLPPLLGLNIDQRSEAFVPFLVVLHAGTATALLAYFWRDWVDVLKGLFTGGFSANGEDRRRLLIVLVIATLPAVVLGFAFNKQLKALFASPAIAAVFLIANGVLLFAAELLRKRALRRTSSPAANLNRLSYRGAFMVGLWQCLAFLPGISRSGATMAGGLLQRLTHEQAARLSFLMATPVIAGATVLEAPKLFRQAANPDAMPLATVLAGGVVAGVAAYLSVAFLMRYFRTHEVSALNPFAIYCVVLGVATLAVVGV